MFNISGDVRAFWGSNFEQDPKFLVELLARSRLLGLNLEQIYDFCFFFQETYILGSILGIFGKILILGINL